MFRKSGEQCKATAEKGSHICYSHAGQLAAAVRREQERKAVLAEAVAQMRLRGRPECKMADLFMDFEGIQVTLAVAAKALIDGRIDCKTAGRLLMQLQTMSKLLRMVHGKGREGRKENQMPQIRADERRLCNPGEKAHSTTESRRHGEKPRTEMNWTGNNLAANPWGVKQGGMKQGKETRIALVAKVRAFSERCGWGHAPPELLRAA